MFFVFLAIGVLCSVLICVLVGYQGLAFVGFFLLWFALCFLGAVFVYILLLWIASLFVDRNKIETEEQPFYRFLLEESISMLMPLLGAELHFQGGELLPDGRFLFVGNHRSAYDPFVAIWALRGRKLSFISKPSNFLIPIGGAFMRKCGFLPIDRDNDKNAFRTILTAAERMKRGVFSFGVYPEGTRSKTGELLPFRNGCFKAAQRANVPIVVAAVTGTERITHNFPLRKTQISFTICGVLDAETVQKLSTAEIGNTVRGMIESAI